MCSGYKIGGGHTVRPGFETCGVMVPPRPFCTKYGFCRFSRGTNNILGVVRSLIKGKWRRVWFILNYHLYLVRVYCGSQRVTNRVNVIGCERIYWSNGRYCGGVWRSRVGTSAVFSCISGAQSKLVL